MAPMRAFPILQKCPKIAKMTRDDLMTQDDLMTLSYEPHYGLI